MPKIKVELEHKELEEILTAYVKERLGMTVMYFQIQVNPGQAEMTPTTYRVIADCE